MTNHRAKSSLFLYAFIMALLADIALIELSLSDWRILSKGSLMPLLILHIIFAAQYKRNMTRFTHLLALIFSFIGDVVLQFSLFIPGLISFLCAHLAYLYLFYGGASFRFGWPRRGVILLLAIPAYFLGTWLTVEQPNMQIPVILYGFVILNMFAAVIQIYPRSLYLLTGASLFLISDLILSLGLFKEPFPHQSSWVMSTYGLAQLFLLLGILQQQKVRLGQG